MLGIGQETCIFFYAGLSGIVILLSYQILRVFRRLLKHNLIMINLEDFLYWIAVSAYLFRQMYRTTYGSIRWFFVLGVVSGIILVNFCIHQIKKMFVKIKKPLEKSGKTQ